MTGKLTPPTGSRSPLAPFAHDWVGGDIHGLSSLAGTLYGYLPQITGVVTALDHQVDGIVTAAGWQGTASSAFTSHWEKVSAETTSAEFVIARAASITDTLAVNLAAAESALEDAADQAGAHGVQIGPGGQPPAACYASSSLEEWRQAYARFYQECLHTAHEARIRAAGDLQALHASVTRGSGGPGLGQKLGDGNTVGDYLADLLAAPTAYAKGVAEDLKAAKADMKTAMLALAAARRAARAGEGGYFRLTKEPFRQMQADEAKLKKVQQDLAAAEEDENLFSKVLGTQLRDVPAVANALGRSDAALLSKTLDLPVIDVAAAGVSTVLGAEQDIHNGVPGWVAYPAETGASVASIAAGTVAAGATGTAVTGLLSGGVVAGLSVAGAPVIGVAAGIAVGGVVAYGVGDYLHNYIAGFGQEWHQHGALGAVYDLGAAGTATWDDTRHLADDVGGAASSAWHSVTSWL